MILSTIDQERKQINHFINSRLQGHFDKEFVDFSKRTRVEADLEKWRPEIKEIWDQKQQNTAHWFSIYFDDEFVCSFPMDSKPDQIEYLFLRNIAVMFRDGTIFFDKNEYIIRDELARLKKKDKDDKLKKQLDSQPNEVKRVIKELNESQTAA